MMTQEFVNAINNAAEAAELLTDPAKKGEIWARIAQAIATANLVDVSRLESTTIAEKKEEKSAKEAAVHKKAEKKEEPVPAKQDGDSMERKPRPVKNPAPPKQEKKKEPAPEAKTNEADLPTEWDDELKEKFGEELNYIVETADIFGDEAINDCVSTFMGGAKNVSLENINPRNVQAFASFLKSLRADYEKNTEKVPF